MTIDPNVKLERIISGGQTGADQGGLLAARDCGIWTGGVAPKGWRTENGPAPWLANYQLVEAATSDYTERTRMNVEQSDATILFGKSSAGTNQTIRLCSQLKKPYIWQQQTIGLSGQPKLSTIHYLRTFIKRNVVKTGVLNIAGNRESVTPGIALWVREILRETLSEWFEVNEHWPEMSTSYNRAPK